MTGTAGLRRRRAAVAIAGCVLVASLLGGCAARDSLGTSDNSCYLALPTATKAVHDHGRFVGVHLYTLSKLRAKAHRQFASLAPQEKATQRVCVTAFSGAFRRASVTDPHGRPSGVLAVVVTEWPSNVLLGTVILARAPLLFGHSHIG
jgi:hypothetical protein